MLLLPISSDELLIDFILLKSLKLIVGGEFAKDWESKSESRQSFKANLHLYLVGCLDLSFKTEQKRVFFHFLLKTTRLTFEDLRLAAVCVTITH